MRHYYDDLPEGMHVETEPHNIWDGRGRLVARVNWGAECEDDAMPTRRVATLLSASKTLLDACKAALARYDEARAKYMPRYASDDDFADNVLRPAIEAAEVAQCTN